MSLEALKYPARSVCEALKRDVANNIDRYLTGNFLDVSATDDWSIPFALPFDPTKFEKLEEVVGDDAKGSLIIWDCLSGLAPSVAREGRVWTRLSHVEGLLYSRARWIGTRKGEEAIKSIQNHFFADTRTQCRDDNAIGRLWWTAYVAYRAMPDAHAAAISAIWKTADIRSNVIERPWIVARPALAAAVVRTIITNPSASASEDAFRNLMKSVNARGGGMLFEAMTQDSVNDFVASCVPTV